MAGVTMLYPGHSAEDDFVAWSADLRRHGITEPIEVRHTWAGPTDHEMAALRALGADDQLHPTAKAAVAAGVAAIVWACTSGSFVDGLEGARDQAARLAHAAGVPATSTSLAFVDALHHLDARRVAIAASYPEPVSRCLSGLLTEAGFEVAVTASSDVPSGEDAGRWSADRIRQMVDDLGPLDADVVVVPDTALHTAGLLPQLEADAGRPVLTANQVSVWSGLRLLGRSPIADGVGSLFRA
ncbi:maleate cis-trans isomerase family protein [Naumannella halotolerans]|nr:aspartate/glutamate racemase family protein [Naumannella halotolerans]